jgi:hypothetical protein
VRVAEPIDSVLVVFNPGSTGDADVLAEQLRDELGSARPELAVRLVPTEYAGHARVIAREAASAGGRPLIVSASGDGGYNEVVNGIMDVPGTDASAAVLAAGNANDHDRVTARRPLVEAILDGRPEPMDLLEMHRDDDPPHYAHSYIGFGLTPVVALQIEKGGKGSIREVITTVRAFWAFTPFEVEFSRGDRRRAVGHEPSRRRPVRGRAAGAPSEVEAAVGGGPGGVLRARPSARDLGLPVHRVRADAGADRRRGRRGRRRHRDPRPLRGRGTQRRALTPAVLTGRA